MAEVTRTYTWTTSNSGTAGNKWGDNYTIPTHENMADKTWLYARSAATISGTTNRILTITHIKLTAFVTSIDYCKWYGHVVWNNGNNSLNGTYTHNSGSQSASVIIMDRDVDIPGSYIDPTALIGVCIQGSANSSTMGTAAQKRVVLTVTFEETNMLKYYINNGWQNCQAKYYDGTNWIDVMPNYYDGSSW